MPEMQKLIIRNDDISVDTNLELLKEFCDLCDQYGHKIIQAITPIGITIPISAAQNNDSIINLSGSRLFIENIIVYEYLLRRDDLFGVHGLWHTHRVREEEISLATKLITDWGFYPEYYVCPFNEGDYGDSIHGLKVLNHNCDRIETYFDNGILPKTEIGYLHSWRFNNSPYNLNQLEKFFKLWNTR